MSAARCRPIHVAHVIHRLQIGGLENGLVNLVNRLPRERYRHTIVCLTGATDFRRRLGVPVDIVEMGRRGGLEPGLYLRLWHLFRRVRPDIVHTRNLAALEAQWAARLAGVRGRVHGEHGRDVTDLDNSRRRYVWLRRAVAPAVGRFVALSQDLRRYLVDDVGIAPGRVEVICNGVDTERFRPARRPDAKARALLPAAFRQPQRVVAGYVGRLDPVKDPGNLVAAVAALRDRATDVFRDLAVAIVGDGSQAAELAAAVREAGLSDTVWLAGARADVPALMAAMDVFVLPSLAEGISNPILEAMASGLPVVATAVGGNPELVVPEQTGMLVPRADPAALADGLAVYLRDRARMRADGVRGRERVERNFSIDGMVGRYAALYERLAASRPPSAEDLEACAE